MKKSVLTKVMVMSVLLSGLTTTTRAQGGSLEFPGVEQYVLFNTNPLSALTGDCTMEVWFYQRTAIGSDPWQRIWGFGGSDRFVALMPNTDAIVGGGVWFAISNTTEGGQQLLSTNTPLARNMWHHIAITITHATNTGRMYIDGQLVATNTNMTIRPGSLSSADLDDRFRFGRSNFLTDPYFNGFIDEIRFSTTVRYTGNFTPTRSAAIPDAQTAGLWSFDEGMGQVLLDHSGNGLHAQIGSDPVPDDQDPNWSFFNTLPIKFKSFTTHKSGGEIKLKWSTSNIDNDAEFVVERSFTGSKFEPIGSISVIQHQSKTNFDFADKNPGSSKVYYRIRLVEANTTSYSRIAMRHIALGTFKLQSNLVRGRLNIVTDDPTNFIITDAVGRAVHKFYLSASSDVDISHLRTGVYFLNNNEGTVVRFIKQ